MISTIELFVKVVFFGSIVFILYLSYILIRHELDEYRKKVKYRNGHKIDWELSND